MDRLLDAFQIFALASMVALGVARAAMLYARGIRVLVIDRARSLGEGVQDLLIVGAVLAWGVELLAYSWPLGFHVTPASLGVVVLEMRAVQLAGVAFMLAGLTLYVAALLAFGESWRVGIDRDEPGGLVTGGVFARSRNPIYLSLDLVIFGSFLAEGRLVLLLLAATIAALLHAQVVREESFLQTAYDGYAEYAARVRRYWTWQRT